MAEDNKEKNVKENEVKNKNEQAKENVFKRKERRSKNAALDCAKI